MITLDTNMYLICSLFNISPQRLNTYTDKTLDEIMETEAEQGNSLAANYDADVLNNPDKLAKIFELTNENNRFAILQNMSQHDLQEMLPYLEKEDLQVGLKYFTKDKLLTMLEEVPKKDLVKYTQQLFSQEQIMEKMPMDEINKVMVSSDIDQDLLLEEMKSLKPEILVGMYEKGTGEEAPVEKSVGGVSGEETIYTNNNDLVNMIAQLPKNEYNHAIQAMPSVAKRGILLDMAQGDKKVMTLFSAKAYTNILSEKQKPELVKASSALTNEELIKMNKNLNQILLANVMTQIDPNKFANVLTTQYKEILKQIVAA